MPEGYYFHALNEKILSAADSMHLSAGNFNN